MLLASLLKASSSRLIIIPLGYVWPAYLCFKDLKDEKADATTTWCHYWLVLAAFTAVETVLDVMIFWVPLYWEAKVLFVVYLWHPWTQGAKVLYEQFLKPLLTAHEPTIDAAVEEWKAWVKSHITNNIGWIKEQVMSKAMIAVGALQHYQAPVAAPPLAPVQTPDAAPAHIKVQ